MTGFVVVLAFLALFVLGFPVVLAIGIPCIVYMGLQGLPLDLVAQRIAEYAREDARREPSLAVSERKLPTRSSGEHVRHIEARKRSRSIRIEWVLNG